MAIEGSTAVCIAGKCNKSSETKSFLHTPGFGDFNILCLQVIKIQDQVPAIADHHDVQAEG